jgi:serine/threonine protein kinase/Tfp pilus assembly protein PilF
LVDTPDSSAPDSSSGLEGEAAPGRPEGDADSQATTGVPASSGSRWIAHYRILRRLGEGGMGVVYEAEQQSPHRLVALKVIRGGSHVTEHEVRLFRREAQALGQLDHPGIAAIHEAGCTEEGHHYFAMELVRGQRLDAYMRERPLLPPGDRRAVRSRLHIFLKICDAIQYAHLRGVIHRDLKPSNILVQEETSSGDGGPAVKILDFGLARITDVDVQATATLTDAGMVQGTLAYMSPEQTRGDPSRVDIRSDLYSLGVVLYEMLTGELPIAMRDRAVPEAIRAICEDPPRRPSVQMPGLRGDLETILLKTLEKEPSRRYQSVFTLAEDLRRFLADQPILAHPPSAAYQLRKLMVRHKRVFAFAATVIALIIAFAVTMSVMFGIQTRERARAVREAAKSESVSAFLQRMLGSASPSVAQGRDLTVAQVLDEAAARVDAEFADHPEIRAALHRTIGKTYDGLGRYELAQRHLETALATYRATLGPEHRDVALCLLDLALMRSASGHGEEADGLARQALTIFRKRFGDKHQDVALALGAIGIVAQAAGKLQEAETDFRQALAILRDTERDGLETASALSNLSQAMRAQTKYGEAEALEREAATMFRRHLGDSHPSYEQAISSLGLILEAQGKTDEAIQMSRESVAIARRIYGATHPDLAVALNNLGGMLGTAGRYREGADVHREALAIRRQVLAPDHPDLAFSMNNLGVALTDLGEYGEAEQVLREALAMRKRIHGDVHPSVATTLNNLGTLLDEVGRLDEAEPLLRETLAARRQIYGERSDKASTALNSLALLLRKQKKYAEAEAMLREAVAIRRETLGSQHPRVATALCNLGLVLRDQQKYAAAEQALLEAIAISRASHGNEHPDLAVQLGALGFTYLLGGRLPEAEQALREGLDVARKAYPPGHWRTASIVSSLGECLMKLGKFAEAEPLLVEWYETLARTEGADASKTLEAGRQLAALYRDWGKPEQAAALRRP